MSNLGRVDGRLALGLFETAFAALNNDPIAFPLDHGPFGEQVFDASLDLMTVDPYHNGYQAYLYLGPLENETFSPLIPGFYTEDFVKELDLRCRVTFGSQLKEAFGIQKVESEAFVRWMSQTWGQLRWKWRRLGPLNAWYLGSDWEEKLREAKRPEALKEAGPDQAGGPTALRCSTQGGLHQVPRLANLSLTRCGVLGQ